MPMAFTVLGPRPASSPGVAYIGPGDIQSGALGYWGLTAYNAAYATGSNPAIDIVKTSDGSALQTINILASGYLDVATIAGLGYGVSVSKVYDQTGNGNHLTQATLATMPILALNVINGHPTMQFAGAQKIFKATTGTTLAQPFGLYAVARRTGNLGSFGTILSDNVAIGLYFSSTNDRIVAFSASQVNLPALDNQFHSAIFIADGAGTNSILSIDGVNSAPTATGTASWASTSQIAVGDDTSEPLTGDIEEVALYPTFSPANIAGLAANITSRLGAF